MLYDLLTSLIIPISIKKRKELLELFFYKGPSQVGVLTLTLQTNLEGLLEAQSIFAFILSFDILRELELLPAMIV